MKSSASNVRRAAAGVLIAQLSLAAAALAQNSAPLHEDWTRFVPADVKLYAEFQNLSVTRHHLQRVGLWQTIRQLGRLGPPGAASQPWQERTSQLLGMSADQAITELLGVRTALLAVDPLRWDRGLVLAQLGDSAQAPAYLRRWRAVSLEPVGQVSRYRLPTGLLLAQRDRLLLFGPESDDDGLWSRAVLLVAGRGGPSLAANAAFRDLSGKLPAEHNGLIYLAGPQVARVLPIELPPGEEPVLVAAMDARADELTIDVRARPYRTGAIRVPATQPVAPLLPADSIAVWSGTRDLATVLVPPGAAHPPGEGDTPAVLRWTFAYLQDRSVSVIKSLFGSATLVLGRAPAESPDDFEQPTLTCLVDTRDPGEASAAMDFVVLTLWSWLSQQAATASAAEDIPYLKPSLEGDLSIRTVPIGELLARRTRCPFFRRLELSWTAADGRFLVSSSRAQLLHVIEAIRGRGRRLRDDPALLPFMPLVPRDADWLMVRGGPLAGMLRSWLDFAARQRPEALEPQFWSNWAATRLEQQRRLGVGLKSVANGRPGAEVVEVAPDSPAAEYLRVGDVIVAAAGRPLTTTQPAREVAERFRSAPAGRPFALDIRRDDAVRSVSIPLPPLPVPDPGDFDPVAGMKVLIALAEHIDTMTLWRRSDLADLYNARVLVRWKPAP